VLEHDSTNWIINQAGIGLGMLRVSNMVLSFSQSVLPHARCSYQNMIKGTKVIRLMGSQSKRGSHVLKRFRSQAILQERVRSKQL